MARPVTYCVSIQALHEELHSGCSLQATECYSCARKNWVPARGAQVAEGDFLEVVTTTPRVVCHFFHSDFERCKLLDQHLTALARMYIDTRFIRLSAPVGVPHAVATSLCCKTLLSCWTSTQPLMHYPPVGTSACLLLVTQRDETPCHDGAGRALLHSEAGH